MWFSPLNKIRFQDGKGDNFGYQKSKVNDQKEGTTLWQNQNGKTKATGLDASFNKHSMG